MRAIRNNKGFWVAIGGKHPKRKKEDTRQCWAIRLVMSHGTLPRPGDMLNYNNEAEVKHMRNQIVKIRESFVGCLRLHPLQNILPGDYEGDRMQYRGKPGDPSPFSYRKVFPALEVYPYAIGRDHEGINIKKENYSDPNLTGTQVKWVRDGFGDELMAFFKNEHMLLGANDPTSLVRRMREEEVAKFREDVCKTVTAARKGLLAMQIAISDDEEAEELR